MEVVHEPVRLPDQSIRPADMSVGLSMVTNSSAKFCELVISSPMKMKVISTNQNQEISSSHQQ